MTEKQTDKPISLDYRPLHFYGRKFKQYLQEEYPAQYDQLLFEMQIMELCYQVEEEAELYHTQMEEQLRTTEPKPEDPDDFEKMVQYNTRIQDLARQRTLEDVVYKPR